MTQKEVLDAYNRRKSIKGAAADLGCSEDVVRKWLITAGALDTPLIRRIRELRLAGMPQKDIADLLEVSPSTIAKNSPYERGTYLTETKSANAERIRKCRQNKKEDSNETL